VFNPIGATAVKATRATGTQAVQPNILSNYGQIQRIPDISAASVEFFLLVCGTPSASEAKF
jgi:hypothetical protein